MSSIVLQIPKVKYSAGNRPKQCPYCEGATFQRWGGTSKPIKDPKLREVWVYRYRCGHCKKTFRYYPEGVERASQTRRMRVLAVLAWMLGMSYRGLVAYLAALDVTLGRTPALHRHLPTLRSRRCWDAHCPGGQRQGCGASVSAWRDGQAQAEQLRSRHHWDKVRVLGLDGAHIRG